MALRHGLSFLILGITVQRICIVLHFAFPSDFYPGHQCRQRHSLSLFLPIAYMTMWSPSRTFSALARQMHPPAVTKRPQT